MRDLVQFLFYESITQIFLLYHHPAFSITISSMGIDSQSKQLSTNDLAVFDLGAVVIICTERWSQIHGIQ